ncbi:DUF4185 domain-containing protein [Rhodocytophaga rosea]|uniref:DUF4185 domain-containing protein n=1 Tax=Rhodocytophaga rosea TaxID=2704465 RepID=A0A6C0GTW6_9BACT|nr:DUF4185 domain-containing protein [Rhodocytophaga rosea]QHT71476.1 DUF4185 domain-containing protein [Rhodocytophaga rosea]
MKYPFTFIHNLVCISMSVLLCCMCSTKKDTSAAQEKATDTTATTDIETLKFTVEESPEWTALFHRTSGWFGGDGIFAIPLNAKDNEPAASTTETMFIFSDTMIGEISADSTLQSGEVMVNNTVAYLKGSKPNKENIRFQWATNDAGKPIHLFSPNTSTAKKGDYYWLGDGFLNTASDSIYIFAYRMRNLDKSDDWSFKEMSTDLIAIPANSRPPFTKQRQIETPLRFEDGGFGAGIFVNTKESGAPDPDGYIYVYGNRKGLMVARVKPMDFENFSAWRFWDGKEWNADMQQVKLVATDVSNELSISALPDGRYALVFTLSGLSPTVGLRLGRTPYGPFGPVIKVYEAKEMQRKNYITYNAKAHPNLSAPGELLISYNVNAFDFRNEIKANPTLYRPRFIKVRLQQ